MTDSENTNKVIWQAESTHPKLMQTFTNQMREVIDPELGLNVIELGLIRDLIIEDGAAHMNMILTTPFCPYGPAMFEMARKKAEEALKMPVTIEMGMEMWDFSMMEEGIGGDWGLY